MVCIYCDNSFGNTGGATAGKKSSRLAVSNSRPQRSRNQTWRRRLCTACGAVFTSIEAIDLSQALAVQYADATQLAPFDRDELFISLYNSLRHRTSPTREARDLADTVTAHIISAAEHGRVSARTITQTCLNTLRHFDEAAATHYAAFHPL